jgi:hypothetical protein
MYLAGEGIKGWGIKHSSNVKALKKKEGQKPLLKAPLLLISHFEKRGIFTSFTSLC